MGFIPAIAIRFKNRDNALNFHELSTVFYR
jgi:hypothetical protein